MLCNVCNETISLEREKALDFLGVKEERTCVNCSNTRRVLGIWDGLSGNSNLILCKSIGSEEGYIDGENIKDYPIAPDFHRAFEN